MSPVYLYDDVPKSIFQVALGSSVYLLDTTGGGRGCECSCEAVPHPHLIISPIIICGVIDRLIAVVITYTGTSSSPSAVAWLLRLLLRRRRWLICERDNKWWRELNRTTIECLSYFCVAKEGESVDTFSGGGRPLDRDQKKVSTAVAAVAEWRRALTDLRVKYIATDRRSEFILLCGNRIVCQILF